MEAADAHRQAGGEEWPRQVDRAGKLVGLHADERNHAEAAVGLALVIASLTTVGRLILIFSGRGPALGRILGLPYWDLIEETSIER